MRKILHILHRLTGGGPSRALISLVKAQRQLGLPYKHTLATLEKETYPYTLIQGHKAGIDIIRGPDEQTMSSLITAADIVQIHFWNTPALYQYLRATWPEQRRLVWVHISGHYAPQCIPEALIQACDRLAATSPITLQLPHLARNPQRGKLSMIMSTAMRGRIPDHSSRHADAFTIGYVGTTNFGKLHPDFAQMCAAITIPNSRFVICGGGNKQLMQQLRSLSIADRFQFKGFVENINKELAAFDLFGYPLSPQTPPTAELSLQEAMAAGLCPVVFPVGGIKYLVEDGQTGRVVHTPQEYSQVIMELYQDTRQRLRLGENAREYARIHFDPRLTAQQFDRLYRQMMAEPKYSHPWPGVSASGAPANWFVESVNGCAPQFEATLTAPDRKAEQQIMRSGLVLVGSEGGIFHYRNQYPQDAHLRFWSGLAMLGQGQKESAQKEFTAALTLGLDPAYCDPYM